MQTNCREKLKTLPTLEGFMRSMRELLKPQAKPVTDEALTVQSGNSRKREVDGGDELMVKGK